MPPAKPLISVALIGLCVLLFGQAEGRMNRLAAPGLIFSPTVVPNGKYGSPYSDLDFKVTGGKAPYTFSVSGGKLPGGMTLSATGVLSGKPSAAGTYLFTITAVDGTKPPKEVTGSQNYTQVIDKASLTITANNASMTYGGAMPVLMAVYSGFVNGDNASSLTRLPVIITTATASSPSGSYPISVSGATDPNYNFTYSPAIFYIDAATLQVNATPQTKQYGAADPPLSFTVNGLVNGDNTGTITGSLNRNAGENVGVYPITRGSISAGRNYTISFTGNYLTITISPQHIKWTQSLLVGCSITTKLLLTATASSGLPVTYSISDPSVGTLSGNSLTLLKPGTTIVTANQAGDINHSAAAAVTDTLVYESASLIREQWNDVLFFDNSSGDYIKWQWYKNGDSVVGATSSYYSETPELNGQYYVIATNSSGRQIQSCTLSITAGAAIPGKIAVRPNPVNAGALVTVNSNYSSTALQGAILQVIDLSGKVRQQLTAIQPSTTLTMPSEAGIYVIDLFLANGQKTSINVLVVN